MPENVANNLSVNSAIRDYVHDLLQTLGLTSQEKGYDFITDIVCTASDEPERMMQVVNLYLETAKHYNVSQSTVERNIRKAIHTIWSKDHPLLEYILYDKLPAAPKSAFFLAALTEYVIMGRLE